MIEYWYCVSTMPSTPKADPVEILTQLSDDPHVNFYAWTIDVQDAFTTLARTLHPLGLLSSILTARQWEEYPATTRRMPKARSRLLHDIHAPSVHGARP
jgi:hypothetical protein